MSVMLIAHQACAEHDTGPGHPERPARLDAVLAGVDDAEVELRRIEPRRATAEELVRVHSADHVDAIEALCRRGGGAIDPDTSVGGPASWEAALRAAGAGLEAIERLEAGEADSAFCAVRPPGHHARPWQAMGFCLLNNVAVAAATLAEAGERPLVVDIDAHHGNGTQDAFFGDPRVTYVSLHQFPLYPGTGRLQETGEGEGRGTTVNLPLPGAATGDVYLRGIDEVVAPTAAEQGATWLLVSVGFDAHRADPLTGLGLSAGDYGDLARRLRELAPAGRVVAFLEGGYDLDALRASTSAFVAGLEGETSHPEPPTSGGPGEEVPAQAWDAHRRALEP